MSANMKKYVIWIIIAFVLFFVLSQLQRAAGIVRSGIDLLESAARSAITFMQSLFRRRRDEFHATDDPGSGRVWKVQAYGCT